MPTIGLPPRHEGTARVGVFLGAVVAVARHAGLLRPSLGRGQGRTRCIGRDRTTGERTRSRSRADLLVDDDVGRAVEVLDVGWGHGGRVVVEGEPERGARGGVGEGEALVAGALVLGVAD